MIQDRIISQSKVKSRNYAPAFTIGSLGLAAVLCLVFFIGNTPEKSTASKQEVTAYVNENVEQEFDETLLAEELVSSTSEIKSSDENLEEYILNQDIDEQLLREEI